MKTKENKTAITSEQLSKDLASNLEIVRARLFQVETIIGITFSNVDRSVEINELIVKLTSEKIDLIKEERRLIMNIAFHGDSDAISELKEIKKVIKEAKEKVEGEASTDKPKKIRKKMSAAARKRISAGVKAAAEAKRKAKEEATA